MVESILNNAFYKKSTKKTSLGMLFHQRLENFTPTSI